MHPLFHSNRRSRPGESSDEPGQGSTQSFRLTFADANDAWGELTRPRDGAASRPAPASCGWHESG